MNQRLASAHIPTACINPTKAIVTARRDTIAAASGVYFPKMSLTQNSRRSNKPAAPAASPAAYRPSSFNCSPNALSVRWPERDVNNTVNMGARP